MNAFNLNTLEEDKIRTRIIQFGTTSESIHFLYGTNLFGFVVKFSDFAFIVFRGTHCRADWKDNLDIRTVRTFCGHIHHGFARCLDSISSETIHAVKASFDKPYKLCLAGHSKGGALAALATAVLVKNGLDPVALYTFGQPKIGTRSFQKWWEANVPTKYYRVVNGTDIVTHLPPSVEDIPYFVILGFFLILSLVTAPFWFLRNKKKP